MSGHVHSWRIVAKSDLPTDHDPELTVEECSLCGERREYRDSGRYDL